MPLEMINNMMTSSNGNIVRITGPLYGEFTSQFHKGQWRETLMFSLICACTHGWVNNRDADDLRRHRAHYDVTVLMGFILLQLGYSVYAGDTIKHIQAFSKTYIIRNINPFQTMPDLKKCHVQFSLNSVYFRSDTKAHHSPLHHWHTYIHT